jgi:hypothetical protein
MTAQIIITVVLSILLSGSIYGIVKFNKEEKKQAFYFSIGLSIFFVICYFLVWFIH